MFTCAAIAIATARAEIVGAMDRTTGMATTLTMVLGSIYTSVLATGTAAIAGTIVVIMAVVADTKL
jgi:hypothetical protein